MKADKALILLEKVFRQDAVHRQIGKTVSAVNLAKRCHGKVVTFAAPHAKEIQDRYNIDAISYRSGNIVYEQSPLIIDQSVLAHIYTDLFSDHHDSINQNQVLIKQLNYLRNLISPYPEKTALIATHPDKDIRAILK